MLHAVKSAVRPLGIPLGNCSQGWCEWIWGTFGTQCDGNSIKIPGLWLWGLNSWILPEATPGFPWQLFPDLPQPSFYAVQNDAILVQTTLLHCFFLCWESIFWCNLVSLCWLAWTQGCFTRIGLSGCVCLALNMAGCDVCLESTWSDLIHIFLLWLTTKCHLLLSVPVLPSYICTSRVPPSVLLYFTIDSWRCALDVFTSTWCGSCALMWGWAF